MMTLANIGLDFTRHKDSSSAKTLSKSLQIRNRAELSLEQCLKTHFKIINEKRNSIIELISDYYSRIPFDMIIWNKYQIKQCIIDSILLLDTKFDPYKAREAFRLIEAMLINLVQLPWHQEFRKIQTYSGEFVMSINQPLIDVVEVFKAAGFKHIPGEDQSHLLLPETMLPSEDDSESVKGVIFDCLVAQVVLTNIIEVYENCAKAAKQPLDKSSHFSHRSWIQSYFRERCYQTTEVACTKIQDLLNEVAYLMTKSGESSLAGSTSRLCNRRNLVQPTQPSERSDIVVTDSHEISPKISAQERTRKFLAQQSRNDDLIEQSLLKIPPELEPTRKVNQPTKFIDDDSLPQSTYSNKIRGAGQRSTYDSHLGNGHHPHQQLTAHNARSTQRQLSSLTDTVVYNDEVDRHRPMMDLQHNDRELLIPKQERRSVQSNATINTSKTNTYSLDCDVEHNFQPVRHRYIADTPSQLQNSGSTRSSSTASKAHEYSSYSKYEPRHTRLINDKDIWSCSSCTYNNQPFSEVCEMCCLRRPSN